MKLTYKKSSNGWGDHGRVDSYIGTVDNSIKGQELVLHLKRVFKPFGHLQLRGRHSDRKGLARKHGLDHDALRQDVPSKFATSFDVYLHTGMSMRFIPKFQTMSLAELRKIRLPVA